MDMRIPKAVLALYGPTCVGKSTVAIALHNRLGFPIRHCGDILRSRAVEFGIPPNSVTENIHRAVDDETRHIASHREDLIVEGRFLNRVLSGMANVKLVRLSCSETVRTERLASGIDDGSTLREHDESDERLIEILYGHTTSGPDFLVLETSTPTPAELADIVIRRLRTL
jgi:cytidylate kinase